MRYSRTGVIPVLCVFVAGAMANATAADYEVTHGRKVIIDRGIQIQADVLVGSDGQQHTGPAYQNFSNIQLWRGAGFTTFNFWNQPDANGTWLGRLPAGQQWGKVWGDPPPQTWGSDPLSLGDSRTADHFGLFSDEYPFFADLVDLQWSDERTTELFQPGHLATINSLYRLWNTSYPRALAHANFCAVPGCDNPISTADLATYIQQTAPDIVTFDQYPPFGASQGDLNSWYAAMQKFRLAALAGVSGTFHDPLPYGLFMRAFRGSYSGTTAYDTYVNLQHFASLAFGYTWLSAFLYNRYQTDVPAFFLQDGDTTPPPANACGQYPTNNQYPAGDQYPNCAIFALERAANRQTLNLGNYFKRAVSTAVFYRTDSSAHPGPGGVPLWDPDTGDGGRAFIEFLTPYTDSVANGGTAANVYPPTLIGYFMPLQATGDRNIGFVNGLHFMIVNGNAGDFFTADAYAQWYHIVFEFGATGNDSLLKLSRDTGQVELVPLHRVPGTTQYELDLKLPGGVGDVFTAWNSSRPIPGMQARPTDVTPFIAPLLLQ